MFNCNMQFVHFCWQRFLHSSTCLRADSPYISTSIQIVRGYLHSQKLNALKSCVYNKIKILNASILANHFLQCYIALFDPSKFVFCNTFPFFSFVVVLGFHVVGVGYNQCHPHIITK
eukprot:769865_1